MGKACVVQDQSVNRNPVKNGAMLPSRSATVTPSLTLSLGCSTT
jgi:hypothetical protein